MPLDATADQLANASSVMAAVRDCIRNNEKIFLPARANSNQALEFVPNPFGGVLGEYRYQIEGEDDLLHLIVVRVDAQPLSPEEGRTVAAILFEGTSNALVWLKPGTFSQHFYVGHDDLLA
jgi:hypothetical protein